jgi:LysM repeat protein
MANKFHDQGIPIEHTIDDLASEIDDLDPSKRLSTIQNAYNILNSDASLELSRHAGNQRLDELINEFDLGIADPLIAEGSIFEAYDVKNPINHTTYAIKRGDTLSAIALSNGVSLEDLGTANGLTNVDSIRAGASLIIPTAKYLADDARRWYVFDALASGQEVSPEGRSFTSWLALKRYLGSPGPGNQWHHIVEQTPGNIKAFGVRSIQSTDNVVAIPTSIHIGKGTISAYYSGKDFFTNGQTVRQWLSTQSFQAQRQFGLDTIKRFGQ